MSKKISLVTILLGASALIAVGYGVTRRKMSSRPVEQAPPDPLSHELQTASRDDEQELRDALESFDREGSLTDSNAIVAPPDPLDLAINLEGIFDADLEGGESVTVQTSSRIGVPLNGDDQDPPDPDELGRLWLAQATESEPSLSTEDLSPDLDNLAFSDEDEDDSLDEADEVTPPSVHLG